MAKFTKLASLLAGAALAVSGTFPAASENKAEYTLTISSWAPPTHGINAKMWPKFTQMVEEATGGRVTTELKLGMAPPPAGCADRLRRTRSPGRYSRRSVRTCTRSRRLSDDTVSMA